MKNPITGFEFSKIMYKDKTDAIIYRIQKNKNGDKYYFIQSFILENGNWKIKGDNPTNQFMLK